MKKDWFKIAILLTVLILGYLFALNGRYYISENHGVVIDKWKQEIISWGDLK